MTEIKVILDSGQLLDISTLSRDERELLFEQLSIDNPGVPRSIIDGFAEMTEEMTKSRNRLIKPELKELMLRKIIQLSYNGEYNTNVIPIIPSFVTQIKKGAAIQPMRRMKQVTPTVRPSEIPNSIKVRFDTRIRAMSENGVEYIAPPNEEINIIGLLLTPVCEDVFGTTNNDNVQRMLFGNYKFNNVAESCKDFIKPDFTIDIGDHRHDTSTKIMFKDHTDPQIKNVFETMYNYLAGVIEYRTETSAEFIHSQISASIKYKNAVPALEKIFKIPDTWNHAEIVEDEPEHSDILKKIESVHDGKFSIKYKNALLADLDVRGFTKIYYDALKKGVDSASVKSALDLYKLRKANIEFQNNIKNKRLDERNKLNTYKMIIERKFGPVRLSEIEKQFALKPSLVASAKNILDFLKPTERKPVELEYERHEKYLQAVINNKCPHVRLYRAFRSSANSDKTAQFYRDLKKFFKNDKTDTETIKCNNCGFDIICPHFRDFTEMELAGKNFGEIKGKLTKYIDRAASRDSYYCKICGELVSSLEAFGDVQQHDPTVNMNEELKNFMWGEIISLVKYLKFSQLIDVPKLVASIRDACYPFIYELEKKFLKSKTNTADEIKAKKRLYITIYAFAYIIHLIMSNRNRKDANMEFKNFKPKGKNPIVDMIKHAIDIIITSRNIIIRDVHGMTNELIMESIINAYKLITASGAQIITYSSESEDLLITLLLDPVYRYLYTVNKLDEIIHGKPVSKNIHDEVAKIDSYLGASIQQLEKADDIFSRAVIPKFDTKWNLEAFDNIKPIKQGNTYGDAVYNSACKGYFARSSEQFFGRIKSRLYSKAMYVDYTSGSDDQSAGAFMDVKFREPHEKSHAEWLRIAPKETELNKYKLMMSAKNFYNYKFKNNRRWTRPQVSLGRIYDEDGNPHSFNIYLVKRGEEIVEVTVKDISSGVEKGTKFTGKIIDKKCSKCKVKWSESSKLSDEKIKESLDSLHTVSNFFRFYENRCPEGGLHEFSGNNCTKCNIVNNMILNPANADSLSYYNKYKKSYEREREEFAEKIEREVIVKPPRAVKTYEGDYAKWTFNLNILLDLANKLKINHRLLSGLGAIERQDYADVLNGTFIPAEPEDKNDTRIYKLDTHIKNLATEYNMLKYFHRLIKPPVDLSTLIDNSGINKYKISDLAKKLPDIYGDFNARFNWFRQNKNPPEIVSFCIQSFCEMLLKIYNDADTETATLRRDFVHYFVKKVIRGEEMVTKPGHINWSLMSEDKSEKRKEGYDMNFSENVEAETEPDLEETEDVDENFGDMNKPFSRDSLDVDIDPDREDDDDDPYDVGKVGENYGID
jgi:hypothetical protein